MGSVVDFPAGAVCPSKQEPETCDYMRVVPLDNALLPIVDWDEEPEFYGVISVWERADKLHNRMLAAFIDERYAAKFAATISTDVRTGFDEEMSNALREAILEVSFESDFDDFFEQVKDKIKVLAEDKEDESH